MNKNWIKVLGLMVCAFMVLAFATAIAQTPKPKHINRAVETLEAGQPVYYTGSHSGDRRHLRAGKVFNLGGGEFRHAFEAHHHVPQVGDRGMPVLEIEAFEKAL